MEKQSEKEINPGIDERIVRVLGEIAAAAERKIAISTAIMENPHLTQEEKFSILLLDPKMHYKILASTPHCYSLSDNRPVAILVFERLKATYGHLDSSLYKSAMRSYSDFIRICERLNIDVGSLSEN